MSNRPTQAEYENGRRWEIPTAQAFANVFYRDAKVIIQRPYADLDLALVSHDNRMICFLEVKRRFILSTDYAETYVIARKHQAAAAVRDFLKLPTWAIIVFNDRVGSFKLEEIPDYVETRARRDRPGSAREYAFYSMSRFVWHGEIRAEIERLLGEVPKAPVYVDDIPGL